MQGYDLGSEVVAPPPLNRKVGCPKPSLIPARCLRLTQHYAAQKIIKQLHAVLDQWSNGSSPWEAVQLVWWSYPSYIKDLKKYPSSFRISQKFQNYPRNLKTGTKKLVVKSQNNINKLMDKKQFIGFFYIKLINDQTSSFPLNSNTLRHQTVQWIGAQFGTFRSLECRDKSLNSHQKINGFLLQNLLYILFLRIVKIIQILLTYCGFRW